jgi:selenocysteine-specific elongation factor
MVLGDLAATGRLVKVALGPRRSILVAAEVVLGLEERVLRTLGRLHQTRPKLATILRARVCSALADVGNEALVEAIIDRLKAQGKVIADIRTVALLGHTPKLSQGERKLKVAILESFHAAKLTPPGPEDLAAMAGSRANIIADMLALLVDEELLVEIGHQLYLDPGVESEIRKSVVERLSGGSRITMAELRDLLGTTRKYAIPIGEHLDRIGLTVRDGDLRWLGKRWKPDVAEEGPAL